MWTSALQRLSDHHLVQLGLDGTELLAELQRRRDALEEDAAFPYSDMDLPIRDPKLQEACLAECAKQGWRWGLPSKEAGEDVIHRHLTRDRSEVVGARAQAALERQRSIGRSE